MLGLSAHCHCSEISYLYVDSNRSIEGLNEFSMRTSDSDWVPLRLSFHNNSASTITERVNICQETLSVANWIQFRWLQTTRVKRMSTLTSLNATLTIGSISIGALQDISLRYLHDLHELINTEQQISLATH